MHASHYQHYKVILHKTYILITQFVHLTIVLFVCLTMGFCPLCDVPSRLAQPTNLVIFMLGSIIGKQATITSEWEWLGWESLRYLWWGVICLLNGWTLTLSGWNIDGVIWGYWMDGQSQCKHVSYVYIIFSISFVVWCLLCNLLVWL